MRQLGKERYYSSINDSIRSFTWFHSDGLGTGAEVQRPLATVVIGGNLRY